MIQSQMVTPPLAAMEGTTLRCEDGDYEKEHKISASEGADQVRLRGGLGGGGQSTTKSRFLTGRRPVRNDKLFFTAYISLLHSRDSRRRLSPHEHY